MTAVLDSGGLSALADPTRRALVGELLSRSLLPAQVSAAVLTETLTGDARRDVRVDRFLRGCQVRPVAEAQARHAAHLRTSTRRAGSISAVDALVVALAGSLSGAVIITSDPTDIRDLAAQLPHTVTVVAV